MIRRSLPGSGPRSAATGIAFLMLLLAGCGSGPSRKLDALPPDPLPASTALPTAPSVGEQAPPLYPVATAIGSSVAIYDSPVQTEPTRSLPSPQPDNSTLVFLVKDNRPGWFKVMLPVRPNGSTGWIRASEVTVDAYPFRIEVQLSAHKLTVWNGNEVFLEDTVAVGAKATPTALGSFYTTGLFETGATQPFYGPYAYPLSGYSEVLFSFGGGEGQMGIHGTNDPSSLGRSVSNGCIRMSNAAITKLRDTLPVGVPVDIRP